MRQTSSQEAEGRQGRPAKQPVRKRDRTVGGMSASFKRLGESRAAKVATEMSRLRTLADKSRFLYTDKQVEELETFLLDQLNETMSAFREGTGSRKLFRFSDYRT